MRASSLASASLLVVAVIGLSLGSVPIAYASHSYALGFVYVANGHHGNLYYNNVACSTTTCGMTVTITSAHDVARFQQWCGVTLPHDFVFTILDGNKYASPQYCYGHGPWYVEISGDTGNVVNDHGSSIVITVHVTA